MGYQNLDVRIDRLFPALFFPFHCKMLIGFLATIGQHTIFQIRFPQIGDVYKRHSTHIEAEHEHITGKGYGRAFGQL